MAGGTPATEALSRAGVEFVLHAYDHDPDSTDYGNEAAEALGIDPLRIFKTLVVDLGSTRPELAVAVVPVAGMLSLKHAATALGAKRAAMADKALVARSTGYVLGGVSPLGQRSPLPTVIDETAQLWDTIYVSAGKRGLQVELAADDLARVTGATFADIAR
ncbi:MAG: Cys-tRNA(Pro) deacylase [Actinobacteria bacterium HGW-Actinobacteria-5]|nr:MAG: Cys-tRNA(Pro) deacylase [Actinobacteria bacterium HGW-Actinobacteria-5]